MSQDQCNHSLIIHDKFKDLFTIVTWNTRFLPQWYKCKETSYARKCTKPLAQKYKTKQVLKQNSIVSIKLFDFLLFMWFLDSWHIRKKRLNKNNNVKTTKTDKAWTIERLVKDVCLLIVCVYEFKTHNSFFHQILNEMVSS